MRGFRTGDIVAASFFILLVLSTVGPPIISGTTGCGDRALCDHTASEWPARDGGWSYHNSTTAASLLQSLSGEHPDITSYTTAQDMLGVRDIPGGLVIPILLVGDFEEDRPGVLLIGGHHGNEPDSVEAVLGFAQYLLNSYSAEDERVVHIVDRLNIALMPVVNPYGYDHGIRYDENGEDPNRDYPLDPTPVGAHSDGIPLTTAGAEAVHGMAKWYPFFITLSFHTGSEGVFTPWGCNDAGVFSPDHVMFSDLGACLSAASGKGLPYGPANAFPYVSFLTGAYDDHLYGSTVRPDLLFNDTSILPWSLPTATVELDDSKGWFLEGLGDLTDIFDVGGPTDGTVPSGVRVCLASCELACPQVRGSINHIDGNATVNISIAGVTDPVNDRLIITYQNGSTDVIQDPTYEYHGVLPEMTWEGTFGIPDMNGSVTFTFEVSPDRDWGDHVPGGSPNTGPRTLLSLSRGAGGRFNSLLWTKELTVNISGGPPDKEDPKEEGPDEKDELISVYIADTYPSPAPSDSYIVPQIRLDWDTNLSPTELVLEVEGGGMRTSWTFQPENITKGEAHYFVPVPPVHGEAVLKATLMTDRGNRTDSCRIDVQPTTTVFKYPHSVEPLEGFRVLVGTTGNAPDTPIFYGLSRALDSGWDRADDWLFGPEVMIVNGSGGFWLDLEMPAYSGDLFLRTTTLPGWVEDKRQLTSRFSAEASRIPLRVHDKTITLGPSLIRFTEEGFVEGTSENDMLYTVWSQSLAGDLAFNGTMSWVGRDDLSAEDLHLIRDLALEWDMDPGSFSGGWMASFETSEEEGDYFVRGRVIMYNTTIFWAGGDAGEDEVVNGGFFNMTKEEKDGSSGIRWWLLIPLVIALLSVIFTLGLPRRMKAEEGETSVKREAGGSPDERMRKGLKGEGGKTRRGPRGISGGRKVAGAYKARRAGLSKREPGGEKDGGARRAPPPPWGHS